MIILGIILIILKVARFVDWPWLLVLAPFWVPWVWVWVFGHHRTRRYTRSRRR